MDTKNSVAYRNLIIILKCVVIAFICLFLFNLTSFAIAALLVDRSNWSYEYTSFNFYLNGKPKGFLTTSAAGRWFLLIAFGFALFRYYKRGLLKLQKPAANSGSIADRL